MESEEDSDEPEENEDDEEKVNEGKDFIEMTTSHLSVDERLNPTSSDVPETESHEKSETKFEKDGLDTVQKGDHSGENVSDCDEEDLEDLHNQNRTLRPFRNEESLAHINQHRRKHLDSTSVSMASTASSMDPRLIKEKVKRQMKKKAAVQESRRIRKSGESAIITKKKREISQDIKQSVDSDWF